MRRITVAGQNGYDILISQGLIASCGEHIRAITRAKKSLIISDSNVFPIYGEKVKTSLEAQGFEVFCFVFPAGEPSKNMNTVNDMIKALCEGGLTRQDIVVALGGGVTGDMAGFASAIYLRGIDFVQIPTTLLSQVDSSVGGKTGCDLSFGKNLVGAFHNPRLVLVDTETLSTLPERYIKDGMGEVIKYGCIKSADLFEKLALCENFSNIMQDVIYECIDIKRIVVENDFTEKGERMLLNFGHTPAHAIEKIENFSGLAHGEAVGVGMLKVARAGERIGITEVGTAEKIESLLKKFGLPCTTDIDNEKIVQDMIHDKKRRADEINLVLLHSVGNSFIKAFPIKDLKEFFSGA